MFSNIRTTRQDRVAQPVLVYGIPGEGRTERVCSLLEAFDVSYEVINVEEDEAAARYVEHVNHGMMEIPTLVFGDEELIIVNPETNELDQAIRRVGHGS